MASKSIHKATYMWAKVQNYKFIKVQPNFKMMHFHEKILNSYKKRVQNSSQIKKKILFYKELAISSFEKTNDVRHAIGQIFALEIKSQLEMPFHEQANCQYLEKQPDVAI